MGLQMALDRVQRILNECRVNQRLADLATHVAPVGGTEIRASSYCRQYELALRERRHGESEDVVNWGDWHHEHAGLV